MSNPFRYRMFTGDWVETIDAHDRIEEVKRFSKLQLQAALKVRGLQKTVRTAIERRLRKLEKA